MLLSEAKKLLEENGYIVEKTEISEGKIGHALAAGALALGLAAGNADAISDTDVINFEKNKKEIKMAGAPALTDTKHKKPVFYKNKNGDYVHENITSNYTEYTVFYKDKTYKQISKRRNEPEIIDYGFYKNLNSIFYGPSKMVDGDNKHLIGLTINKTVLTKNNGEIDKIVKYINNDRVLITDDNSTIETTAYFDWEYDKKKDTWVQKYW